MRKILFFRLINILIFVGFYSCKTSEEIQSVYVPEYGSLNVQTEDNLFVTKDFTGELSIWGNITKFRLETDMFGLKFTGVQEEFRFELLSDQKDMDTIFRSFHFDHNMPFCYDVKQIKTKYPLYPVGGYITFFDYKKINPRTFIISAEFNLKVAKKSYPMNINDFSVDEYNYTYIDTMKISGKFDSIKCIFNENKDFNYMRE